MSAGFPEGPPPAPRQVLQDLLRMVELPPRLADRVSLTGSDPVLPSSFAVGTVAQATIAAVAAAAADLWTLRGGTAQEIAVDEEVSFLLNPRMLGADPHQLPPSPGRHPGAAGL